MPIRRIAPPVIRGGADLGCSDCSGGGGRADLVLPDMRLDYSDGNIGLWEKGPSSNTFILSVSPSWTEMFSGSVESYKNFSIASGFPDFRASDANEEPNNSLIVISPRHPSKLCEVCEPSESSRGAYQ